MRRTGILSLVLASCVGIGLGATPCSAQISCGTTRCTDAKVDFLKINNGRVWFVVEDYAELGVLVPSTCTVDSVFDEGVGKLALYVSADDSERDLKINFITAAAVTGQTVDFQAVPDPTTGNQTTLPKCMVGFLVLNAP